LSNNEWGDFQTPLELADQVIATLPDRQWGRVLEPTCGIGNFLLAAKRLGQTERVGVEIQSDHAAEAGRTGATVIRRTVFDLHLGQDVTWSNDGPLLVVGNPPWVTNAELGARGSINLPPKSNIRHLSGIEALTGASNFDIAEFIWLKIILELMNDAPTIALLSKTHVARNVVDYCHRHGIPISEVAIRRIDAKEWFGASVDACLLTLTVGGEPDWRCAVYPSLAASEPEAVIGFAGGLLVANIDSYDRVSFADGQSPWEWRQGVKHDAIRVMELSRDDQGEFHNRAGERVDVEREWVYPLLNATDLHRGRHAPTRSVIITQRSLADDTERLASTAPSLWAYLTEHREAFESRRSSIYRNRPRFSMFGIGDYTFAPWKVAVSGLHSPPRFALLAPTGPQPIVVDDTCYFLAFDDGVTAAITLALMCAEIVSDLVLSLSFRDAKRPITKKLLQRVDLSAVLERCDRAAIADRATLALQAVVSPTCVDDYAASISSQRLRLGA
jgi:hypothetical protein